MTHDPCVRCIKGYSITALTETAIRLASSSDHFDSSDRSDPSDTSDRSDHSDCSDPSDTPDRSDISDPLRQSQFREQKETDL